MPEDKDQDKSSLFSDSGDSGGDLPLDFGHKPESGRGAPSGGGDESSGPDYDGLAELEGFRDLAEMTENFPKEDEEEPAEELKTAGTEEPEDPKSGTAPEKEREENNSGEEDSSGPEPGETKTESEESAGSEDVSEPVKKQKVKKPILLASMKKKTSPEKPARTAKQVKPIRLQPEPRKKKQESVTGRSVPEKQTAAKDAKTAVSAEPIARIARERIHSGEMSAGHLLQEARVRHRLSLDQVAQQTKLKKAYIEALERDDVSKLPPPVYVHAYVKSLCEIYGIEEKRVFKLMRESGSYGGRYGVPEEILQHIEKGRQTNIEEESRVRRIMLVASCVLAVLLLSGFIVWKTAFQPEEKPVPESSRLRTVENYRDIAVETEKFLDSVDAMTMTALSLPDE